MVQAHSLDPTERLPWLSDPGFPKPRQPRRSWLPLLLAASTAGAIAYGGWTLVKHGIEPEPVPVESARSVPLPPPVVAEQPRITPVEPSAGEREALTPAAEPSRPAIEYRPRPAVQTVAPRKKAAKSAPAAASPTATPAYEPKAWRSGVPGRIIQVGAYGSAAKAQREWRRIYYRYPLLRPLSPRIIKSKVRGRTFHRLQLGTFSQAHSELLCQRLRATGQGCIVLGLPKRGRR